MTNKLEYNICDRFLVLIWNVNLTRCALNTFSAKGTF